MIFSTKSRIIIIAVFLLFSQCKKDKPVSSPPTPDITPQEVYDYGFFRPGTYWVYKDSVSGSIDSVYVIYGIKGADTVDLGQGDGMKAYEKYEVKMHSTFENYDYYIWYNATWSGKNPRRDKLFFTKSRPGDYVGEIILCEIPAIPGHVLYGCGNGIVLTKEVYQSFLMDTTSYNNVVRISETLDCVQGGQSSNYYLAQNIGIIRKEYIDSNSVWKMLRSNILQ
jgi:hypothetical protein